MIYTFHLRGKTYISTILHSSVFNDTSHDVLAKLVVVLQNDRSGVVNRGILFYVYLDAESNEIIYKSLNQQEIDISHCGPISPIYPILTAMKVTPSIQQTKICIQQYLTRYLGKLTNNLPWSIWVSLLMFLNAESNQTVSKSLS